MTIRSAKTSGVITPGSARLRRQAPAEARAVVRCVGAPTTAMAGRDLEACDRLVGRADENDGVEAPFKTAHQSSHRLPSPLPAIHVGASSDEQPNDLRFVAEPALRQQGSG